MPNIDAYISGTGRSSTHRSTVSDTEFDGDDANTDFFENSGKLDGDLADMDYISWREKLTEDSEILELLSVLIEDITPEHDTKLQTLLGLVAEKINIRLIGQQKSVALFGIFRHSRLPVQRGRAVCREQFGLDTAMITGTTDVAERPLN